MVPSASGTTAGCPGPRLGPACPWLIWLGTEGLRAHNTCSASKRKTPSTVKQLSWHKGGRVIMFGLPPSPYDQCMLKAGLGTLGWRWQGWHGRPGTGRGREKPPPFLHYLVTPKSPPQEAGP